MEKGDEPSPARAWYRQDSNGKEGGKAGQKKQGQVGRPIAVLTGGHCELVVERSLGK